MESYGQGFCDEGYYAGWDGKGIGSQASCNAVCLDESECTYAAYNAGQTCSRYNGETCNLNGVQSHFTYKKTSTSPRRMFSELFGFDWATRANLGANRLGSRVVWFRMRVCG